MKIKFNFLLALLSLGCTQNFFGMINNNGSNGGPNQPPRRLFRDVFTEEQTLKTIQNESITITKLPLFLDPLSNWLCWAEFIKTTVKTYEKLTPINTTSSSSTPSNLTTNIFINKRFCCLPHVTQQQLYIAYQNFLNLDPNTSTQNQLNQNQQG